MSDNKKYYYLKIKENFFESEEIKLLQSMDDGYLFSDILMKLYLKSLKNNGKLMFREHIPYSPKMISTITNHSVTIVEKALTIFRELGLIEVLENGAIYMLDIQNFIGKSSSEGDRKRAYRKKIEAEKLLLKDDKGQMSDNRPPEKEIEKEIEIEKELEKEIKVESGCSDFNIFTYMQQRGFITISSMIAQQIQSDIEMYSLEEVKQAIDIADNNGKHTYSYVQGILRRRRADGVDRKGVNNNGTANNSNFGYELQDEGIGFDIDDMQ